MRRPHVCEFIPPHIHRSIAERGDDDQRRRAYASLEIAAQLRGARAASGAMPGILAVQAGEERRTIYDSQSTQNVGKLVRGEGDKATGDHAVDEAYDGSGP